MKTLHCDKFWAWIFAVLWWPFWKWRPVEIFRCRESIQDIIIYLHMKFRWNRTMWNLCGIVVAIMKMATGRNFSMSVINSGHHYLLTYQILMISDNVEFLWPFWKWRPLELFQCRESNRDIIIYQHMKCCWIGQCWICAVLWWPFWKWWPLELFQCWESNRDIIIYPHMKCRWNRTMLNLCSIVAILKMVTARTFSMLGI
jgi:hypothetical protein